MKKLNLTWGFYYDDEKVIYFKGFEYNNEEGTYYNKNGELFRRGKGKRLVKLTNEGDGW